ncbi:helix-turn-helix domain-containing protein [Epidermidibacterium keratini]|uniref:Helix-turn-helix domain-containing protein n=1 Tax=Epidermidibacterium keratini TaxID=1891644 RepID=A0A7L4YJU1_9ACTN|nr:helix-turn-helix domain-containing protein [Epidermidibacterium keratini]QHB99540.1 helix-turn-helix domain-containing protein [Epidermidibacterium keratini]
MNELTTLSMIGPLPERPAAWKSSSTSSPTSTLDYLYAKAEPPNAASLNQALFKRIVIDDDERVTYEPTDAVACVFAHLDAEVADGRTPETNLPRDYAGQVSNFSTYVGILGRHSKLIALATSDELKLSERLDAPPNPTSRRTSFRLGRAETANIARRYGQGDVVARIAEDSGVSPGTVRRIATNAGIKLRASRVTAMEADQMMALADDGFSLNEIARRVGRSPHTVRRVVRKTRPTIGHSSDPRPFR